MIDPALRDRVIQEIWPSADAAQKTWAILDCARDDRIYPALRGSKLDHLCLFSGPMSREVEEAAPHVIQLAPTYGFTPKLIEMAWGNSWGVFLRIDDFSRLRPHLRSFLRVSDEDGRILFFRYYDPRVLRAYLPTCQTDELRAVFGPITSYITEGEDGTSLLEFRFDGTRLHQRRVSLVAEPAATE